MNRRVAPYLAVVAFGTGCGAGKGDTCDDAPPTLLHWQAATADTQLDLMAAPDGGVPALSPLAYFELDFAGLLAGAKIESADGDKTTPRTDVATITWMGAPAGAPPITAATSYNPGHPVGLRCGSWVRITARPGLPSGAKLAVAVAHDKITSKGGKPFQGADTMTVETLPFAVTTKEPEGPVAPDFTLRLQFTNLPGDLKDHVHVTADGEAIAVELKADMMDARAVIASPATGSWMPGRRYDVAVDVDATDLFGVPLGKGPFTVAFDVVAPGSDAGVARPDAGAAVDAAGDAGQADAATDIGSPDAAATDAPDDVSAAG